MERQYTIIMILSGRLVYSRYEDGTYEAFQYNKQGLLIAAENELSSVNFNRNPLGMVTRETQDGYHINYQYDVFNNLIGLKSSLGAQIDYDYNAEGYLNGISARDDVGEAWTAAIGRNKNGQETSRSLSGGVKATFDYDHEGQPISQKVEASRSITAFKQYAWGPNDKLNNCLNSITGGIVNYRYDAFGSLSSATYSDDGQTIYKNPDATGNLYKTADRSDRRYDKGGKLLKDDQWYYRYDNKGNLVQKSKRNIIGLAKAETVEIENAGLFDKKLNWEMANPDMPKAQALDILPDAAPDLPEWKTGDWAYAWVANGMMKAVKNPQGEIIYFEYDALGRRKAKIVKDRIYRYVWDGNLLLHEWCYPLSERPNLVVNEDGLLSYDKPEPLSEDLITWIYDQDKFTPSAKLVNGQYYSIISDYLGTPVQAYNDAGKKVWDAELDIYGKILNLSGDRDFVPFRYQGQYEDVETGLYYNRFRYYDPESGNYVSKDPIGLEGGLSHYSYVIDVNLWLDVFGLVQGGSYYKVRSSNIGGEVHHAPANSISPLSHGKGPAVWMDKADHKLTGSHGSRGLSGKMYRLKQSQFINKGKWNKALDMDIVDIKTQFGNKYNAGLIEMIDYSHKKGLITKSQAKTLKIKCK